MVKDDKNNGVETGYSGAIPKRINNTTELDEIHNHIRSIFALLEELRLKSRFLRQRQQISLARVSLEDFERTDMEAVEETFEG